ncbi:site-specific integrase [Mycetocola manganoxydans]|uniref:Site-specific integrase n=1 Tax=Mycetocola manganoxydans TaxID=699879 RepID=A0A3L6ZP07_9MICO|nr:site-specific integrase [Mycetocola manganoxydans]RLP69405.1 site-specific integrase [Mycetocola manganoxydans]GHD50687.1 site-specific integrase [Mycetocola manganoxydans]
MGSVQAYETAAGKRWRVLYRRPDHQQTQKRGFPNKKAAELYLASVEISKANGEYVDPAAARAVVGDLGVEWLARQTHLKPSAFRSLDSAWRVHVEPRWGATPIAAIMHTDVQKWVSELGTGTKNEKPKGSTTVKRSYGVLAAILDDAVRDRRLSSNPARGVNLPRKTSKKRVYLTHAQVQLLADSAGVQSTLVLFLAYTGLRWGEATGMRVQDLDALRRRVSVHENAVNVGGRIVVGTPKSHASRSVPFPDFLSEPLARLCEGKERSALLFGNGRDHLRSPDVRDGWYVSAIRKAQRIDPTFPTLTLHDLRHTAASLAISAGANVKAVQRMLGHASAAMTLDTYADLFDDDLDAVATALNHAKANSTVAKVLPIRPSSAAEKS